MERGEKFHHFLKNMLQGDCGTAGFSPLDAHGPPTLVHCTWPVVVMILTVAKKKKTPIGKMIRAKVIRSSSKDKYDEYKVI